MHFVRLFAATVGMNLRLVDKNEKLQSQKKGFHLEPPGMRESVR